MFCILQSQEVDVMTTFEGFVKAGGLAQLNDQVSTEITILRGKERGNECYSIL